MKLNFRKKDDARNLNYDEAVLFINLKDLPHLKSNDLVKMTSVDDENVTIMLKVSIMLNLSSIVMCPDRIVNLVVNVSGYHGFFLTDLGPGTVFCNIIQYR